MIGVGEEGISLGILAIFLANYIVIIIVTVILAENKGRPTLAWCLAVIIFMPIILILTVLPKKEALAALAGNNHWASPYSQAKDLTANDKTCPQCAENVKKAAKICRYCNHAFERKIASDQVRRNEPLTLSTIDQAPKNKPWTSSTPDELRKKKPFQCPHCGAPMPKTHERCFSCGESSAPAM